MTHRSLYRLAIVVSAVGFTALAVLYLEYVSERVLIVYVAGCTALTAVVGAITAVSARMIREQSEDVASLLKRLDYMDERLSALEGAPSGEDRPVNTRVKRLPERDRNIMPPLA